MADHETQIEFFKRLVDGAENSNHNAEQAMSRAYDYLHGGRRKISSALESTLDGIESITTHSYYMGEDSIADYAVEKSVLDRLKYGA